MTDKQIINVSDCNYYNNGECTNSAICQCNCTNVVSCYYKEYKRKEQECNEFKELYNYYAFDRRKPENITELKICINGVNEELIRLQQENEELTSKCSQLEEKLQKYQDNEQQEKEMQKLYNKFNGNSLIEKRSPYGQF